MTIKTGSIVDDRKIHLNRNLFTKLEVGQVKIYKASKLAAKTATKHQDLYKLNVFSNQSMDLNKHGLKLENKHKNTHRFDKNQVKLNPLNFVFCS